MYNNAELLKRVGNLSQLCYTRPYELTEGWARGMRAIDVNNGSGLQFTILPDRGLDISYASFKGLNLSYITPNGETHPAFYQAKGIDWLYTFNGGLLTTCGLSNVGGPCEVNGEEFGLHGRYSCIPAHQVISQVKWENEQYVLSVKGIIEESRLFGVKIRNEREIKTYYGKNSIEIIDTFTNIGFSEVPFSLLYHFNLGYPFLDSCSFLELNSEKTYLRDEIKNLSDYKFFGDPIHGFSEEVFIHHLKPDTKGNVHVSIINPERNIKLKMQYPLTDLPYFVQWKMMGEGEYVLGMEPSTTPCFNRKALLDNKNSCIIKPGEILVKKIRLEVESYQ